VFRYAADVVHATTILTPSSRRPLVVTIHDLAFLHDTGRFTARGHRLFRASLDRIRRDADLVLCSSQATLDDCLAAGLSFDRLRLVPLGVERSTPAPVADFARWRNEQRVGEHFVLFVGTLEPRKNLQRLLDAFALLPADDRQLVVAGPTGWGDDVQVPHSIERRVRLVGSVSDTILASLYAAAAVFCYPSLREGFGLPVLEAMAHDTPVVTSLGSSTAEVAGDAAVLVDPMHTDDIARGLLDALARPDELRAQRAARVAQYTWAATADRTLAAYRDVAR
jgi:glycosyltransferase involved in cell wall biosynthesis